MIKYGIDMKRDMDLIREMLLAIESDAHGFAPKIEILGYTQEQIGWMESGSKLQSIEARREEELARAAAGEPTKSTIPSTPSGTLLPFVSLK
jgi:hypothetical protein